MTNDERLLTDSDVSGILQLPPGRVLKLARQGEIPSVVLPGNEIRFSPTDLSDWLNRRRRPAKEDAR